MQSHQTCQGVCREVIYILCMMERHRKARSVDGCFPASHIHIPPLLSLTLWVTGTETFSSSRSVSRWEGWRVLSSSEMISLFYSSLLFPRCLLSFLFFVFAQSLFHFFSFFFFFCLSIIVLTVCVCVYRIWWMISARSSSWRWATWTEARITEPEAEVACQSGAAVSPLQEHTGEEVHTNTHNFSWQLLHHWICMYVCMYAHTYIFIVVVSLSMIWNAWGPLRPSRLPGSICRQKPKFDTTS